MTRGSIASCWCILFAVIELADPAATQEIRLGSELVVNSYTVSNQLRPSVAVESNGDFVVVWYSAGQDGDTYGVFGQRYSSAGSGVGTEFQVNTFTTSQQRDPSVAADTDGDFVVAWSSAIQDGNNIGIFARRFSSSGAALATEIQVNSYTTGDQENPAVAMDTAGGFVVAWPSSVQDGGTTGVFARRFTAAGAALATEFRVNTYTLASQDFPALAVDAEGDFVIVWSSAGQDASSYGIFGQRFSSDGAFLASEFQANAFTTDIQSFPSVAAADNGDFLVVWHSSMHDGSLYGVFGRRFSSAGTKISPELQINTYTAGSQSVPSVAATVAGGFVVTWQSYQDGVQYGIFAQRLSSAGASLAAEFIVNSYTLGNQKLPAVAADDSGRFVIAWQSVGPDGQAYGVAAQRFAVPAILDIDGNGATAALTDGVLVLRYLFGFTGATLVSGAFDAVGCTRCTAPAIEGYLAGLV